VRTLVRLLHALLEPEQEARGMHFPHGVTSVTAHPWFAAAAAAAVGTRLWNLWTLLKPLLNCKDRIEIPVDCKDPVETPVEL
jgi:hypothetical protein